MPGAHGNVVLNDADGSFVYTPDHNYLGADAFTYTVFDLDFNAKYAATVHLTVLAHAPPPPTSTKPTGYWMVGATGTVYSFITVRRALDPAFADEIPYSIATVDLDDRARALGRLEGTPAIGARVVPEFVDHPGWTELRFRVSEPQ